MRQNTLDSLDTDRLVLGEYSLDTLGDLPVLSSWLYQSNGNFGSLVSGGEKGSSNIDDGKSWRRNDDSFGSDYGVTINVCSETDLDEIVGDEVGRRGWVRGKRGKVLKSRINGKTSRESDS